MTNLPVLNTPHYKLTLPSTGKQIKYRPFLVKEEKIFLIAMQTGTADATIDALKQIITNCTYNAVDVETLSTYDIEWIFLNIRIKSKGGVVNLAFECKNTIKENDLDVECGHVNNVAYNLEHLKVKKDPAHTTKIMITDTVGVVMKYPTLEIGRELEKALSSDNIEQFYDVFPSMIDSVFDGDSVSSDYTPDELKAWLEGLTDDQFKKIQDFFVTMPKLKGEIEIKCQKCGHKEQFVMEGLENFLES